ncbi:hypothetical protein HK097_008314 [Rhizophlyctis rosea]|uniref:E3 ubiquitin ligase complex SCF subunit n=1 Tax=Rhizophlyctis rosea TaxID=64517 RepID=A0AAD5X4L7_9FUNG|nr:hypothetical protein HK097_008314 [Rhizophlyctis rosea]
MSDTLVTLTSQEGKPEQVPRRIAERSTLLKNMLEDVGESNQPIPLPNVSHKILKRVLEYCIHHKDDPQPPSDDDKDSFDSSRKRSDDIDEWDQKFIKGKEEEHNEELFQIILAANYLDIKPLLDLGCKTVANMIKGKSPEQIREMFNIENDFTPEEEDQIRRENEWAADA